MDELISKTSKYNDIDRIFQKVRDLLSNLPPEAYQSLTIMGILLILIGVILVLLPIIANYLPSLEKLPPILVYVYRSDNFYFVTSPLLILISLILLILYIMK